MPAGLGDITHVSQLIVHFSQLGTACPCTDQSQCLYNGSLYNVTLVTLCYCTSICTPDMGTWQSPQVCTQQKLEVSAGAHQVSDLNIDNSTTTCTCECSLLQALPCTMLTCTCVLLEDQPSRNDLKLCLSRLSRTNVSLPLLHSSYRVITQHAGHMAKQTEQNCCKAPSSNSVADCSEAV